MQRSRRIPLVLALVALGALAFLAMRPAVFGADKAKLAEGMKIFEAKCLKCHKPDKFKSQAHDKKGWDIVLSRMIRNNACELNDRESDALSEYLADRYGE